MGRPQRASKEVSLSLPVGSFFPPPLPLISAQGKANLPVCQDLKHLSTHGSSRPRGMFGVTTVKAEVFYGWPSCLCGVG